MKYSQAVWFIGCIASVTAGASRLSEVEQHRNLIPVNLPTAVALQVSGDESMLVSNISEILRSLNKCSTEIGEVRKKMQRIMDFEDLNHNAQSEALILIWLCQAENDVLGYIDAFAASLAIVGNLNNFHKAMDPLYEAVKAWADYPEYPHLKGIKNVITLLKSNGTKMQSQVRDAVKQLDFGAIENALLYQDTQVASEPLETRARVANIKIALIKQATSDPHYIEDMELFCRGEVEAILGRLLERSADERLKSIATAVAMSIPQDTIKRLLKVLDKEPKVFGSVFEILFDFRIQPGFLAAYANDIFKSGGNLISSITLFRDVLMESANCGLKIRYFLALNEYFRGFDLEFLGEKCTGHELESLIAINYFLIKKDQMTIKLPDRPAIWYLGALDQLVRISKVNQDLSTKVPEDFAAKIEPVLAYILSRIHTVFSERLDNLYELVLLVRRSQKKAETVPHPDLASSENQSGLWGFLPDFIHSGSKHTVEADPYAIALYLAYVHYEQANALCGDKFIPLETPLVTNYKSQKLPTDTLLCSVYDYVYGKLSPESCTINQIEALNELTRDVLEVFKVDKYNERLVTAIEALTTRVGCRPRPRKTAEEHGEVTEEERSGSEFEINATSGESSSSSTESSGESSFTTSSGANVNLGSINPDSLLELDVEQLGSRGRKHKPYPLVLEAFQYQLGKKKASRTALERMIEAMITELGHIMNEAEHSRIARYGRELELHQKEVGAARRKQMINGLIEIFSHCSEKIRDSRVKVIV